MHAENDAMTTATFAIPMVVAVIRLLWTTQDQTRVHLRERLRTLVPLGLALIVVVLATLGYLELVAALLESLE